MDVQDIAEVIQQWTGIPVNQMLETEAERLLKMEERLHERIIGQDEAITAISDAIRRARSGLKIPVVRLVHLFLSVHRVLEKLSWQKPWLHFYLMMKMPWCGLDMSEYREEHTVSRLFGAPPGYMGYEEGGQLTEAVRRRPYRVILFDEIEKAHPEVWNSLLQILDDGRLTDGQGRVVDFRNTVLIMTSNLGTEFVRKGGTLGFLQESVSEEEKPSTEKLMSA